MQQKPDSNREKPTTPLKRKRRLRSRIDIRREMARVYWEHENDRLKPDAVRVKIFALQAMSATFEGELEAEIAKIKEILRTEGTPQQSAPQRRLGLVG